MNDNDKDAKHISSSNNSYPLKGLARFGGYMFSGFLTWCALNYPMSDTMQSWFFVWAVAVWLFT